MTTTTTKTTTWNEAPLEVLAAIAHHIPLREVKQTFARVCRRFRDATLLPQFWADRAERRGWHAGVAPRGYASVRDLVVIADEFTVVGVSGNGQTVLGHKRNGSTLSSDWQVVVMRDVLGPPPAVPLRAPTWVVLANAHVWSRYLRSHTGNWLAVYDQVFEYDDIDDAYALRHDACARCTRHHVSDRGAIAYALTTACLDNKPLFESRKPLLTLPTQSPDLTWLLSDRRLKWQPQAHWPHAPPHCVPLCFSPSGERAMHLHRKDNNSAVIISMVRFAGRRVAFSGRFPMSTCETPRYSLSWSNDGAVAYFAVIDADDNLKVYETRQVVGGWRCAHRVALAAPQKREAWHRKWEDWWEVRAGRFYSLRRERAKDGALKETLTIRWLNDD